MLPSFQKLVAQPFPKIICIGKNYLKHVKEMGGATLPTSPVIFLKPWSSLSYAPSSLSLPIAGEHRIDHELELGVLIGKGGSKIEKSAAMGHVGGYFLGIDFTDRGRTKSTQINRITQKAKDYHGHSLKDKTISAQCPHCSRNRSIHTVLNWNSRFGLNQVNGVTRQKDSAGHMHFKIDELISYISQFITLIEGDLILTGTPEGVGGVQIGDTVEAYGRVNQQMLATLKFTVTK